MYLCMYMYIYIYTYVATQRTSILPMVPSSIGHHLTWVCLCGQLTTPSPQCLGPINLHPVMVYTMFIQPISVESLMVHQVAVAR